MRCVIGARFKDVGKIYYFSCEEFEVKVGDNVIVETSRGIEYGKCIVGMKYISNEDLSNPLKKCIRIATEEDENIYYENKRKEKEAFIIANDKIRELNLKMNLIEVEYTFDNSKIIFYFIAEGRVDFRDLVKILASIFRVRIELRQIGVRDEAKSVGGIGTCGRTLCCSTFLDDFTSVSIKMAKEQELSLNPSKISGMCGRLMCCLKYEQDTYDDIKKKMPKVGSIVDTSFGMAEVIGLSILKERIKVRIIANQYEEVVRDINVNDIKGYISKINRSDDDNVNYFINDLL